MMARISVIVPVYNVRDYLKAGADSIRSQSFSDWEMILVDDGSTDGSGEICDILAEEDGRIRAVHQVNAGVGVARNAGLNAAAGEYVLFMDSDDSYAPDALERLLSLAENSHADAAAAGALCVDETGTEVKRFSPESGVFSQKEEILRAFLLRSDGLYGCWGKIFRAELLRDLRFSAYTRAEDALFCTKALSRCGAYVVSEESLYRYFRRSDSVTMSRVRTASADQVWAWEEIYALLERDAPSLCPFAAKKLIHDIDQLSEAYAACRPEGWREQLSRLRRAHNKWYLRQYPPGKTPARAYVADGIYRLSPALYYRIAGGRG